MNFYPLTQTENPEVIRDTKDTKDTMEVLKAEYKSGREVGKIRLGTRHFFFRSGLKTYFIPYTDISRCFRRVMTVPAKLCCGKGDFQVENLVIWDSEKEIAQIQLPGTKAARILMDELKPLLPNAQFCCPAKTEAD